MAVDPLRGRIDNNIRTPVERVAQVATGAESVVDNEWHAVAMCGIGDSLYIGYAACGITHTLYEYCSGIIVDKRLEVGCLIGGRDTHLDAEFAERMTELVVCAAVEQWRRNDILPFLGQGRYSYQNRAHTRCHSESTYTTVQGCNALLVCRRSGVLEAGIDIAGLAEVEKVGSIFTCFESVCSSRVYSHSTSACFGSVIESCMNLSGVEA